MKKEINPSYIKICKMLKKDHHKDKHIVNCPLYCEHECRSKIMIWRNHNLGVCLGADREIPIGELDMILTSEFDADHEEIEKMMRSFKGGM